MLDESGISNLRGPSSLNSVLYTQGEETLVISVRREKCSQHHCIFRTDMGAGISSASLEALRRRIGIGGVTEVDEEELSGGTSTDGQLARHLGLLELTYLGMGSIIGAGIYVLVGFTARDIAGPGIVLSYCIAGLTALCSALSYATLSGRISSTGGAFAYAQVIFGDLIAWLCGWSMCLEMTLSSSAVSRGFSAYMHTLLGRVAQTTSTLDPIALALIIVLSCILCIGIRESARFNIIVCSLNISCILFVICSGMSIADLSHVTENVLPYGMSGVFSAASIVFFSFIGFDYIANASEEAINPTRDIPRSIIGSLLVASILYVGMSCTMVLMVNYNDIDINAPFSAGFISKGKSVTAYIVSTGALCGIVTSTMTGLLANARLLTVLGRHRFLPSALARVFRRTNTPVIATCATGSVAGILAFCMDISTLTELVSAGTLFVFYVVNIGALVLVTTHGHHESTVPQPCAIAITCISISPMLCSILSRFGTIPWMLMGFIGLIWAVSSLWLHRSILPTAAQEFSRDGGSNRFFTIWAPAFGVLSTGFLFGSLHTSSLLQFLFFMIVGLVFYAVYGCRQNHDTEKNLENTKDPSTELISLIGQSH